MPTRWLQHPVTVFLIPLVTLLCLPQLYKLLPYDTDPSYDDTKLQRIANLMDDIYGTLANSTFIPHNAITRSPHIINKTALPCKPSTSVLRLMELLPYVDLSLTQEPDWIYGGHFMDYRNSEHLAELCDPLRGQSIGWTDYMSPSDVALTNWGTGGWNNDRTCVMIYNTERDAIRIFDAEMWVERVQAKNEFGGEMNDWWFEDGYGLIWDRADGATHVLRAVANNYRSSKRTPWGTSNREKGFGASPEAIKTLLQRNGWPNSFKSDQFNVDFIRAQHKPSGKGYAEAAQRRIDDLAGYNHTVVEDGITTYDFYQGQIRSLEQRASRHLKTYEAEVDDEDRALHQQRYLRTLWDVDDLYEELTAAKAEVAKLCPDGVCVKEEDMVLWEFLAVQRTHEEARYTNHSEKCERRLSHESSNDPAWLEKCIVNKAAERKWLDLAYEQSRTEALAHCKETGCELLPFKDVFDRARDKIAEVERIIEGSTAKLARVEAKYQDKIPHLGAKVRDEIEMVKSALVDRHWILGKQIETLEEEMTKLKRGEAVEKGQKWLFDYLRDEED